MLAVEPRGGDSGDEELGAVAAEKKSAIKMSPVWCMYLSKANLRVGTSVGHGEKTGTVVLVDEVLIGELLAVDGLATSALYSKKKS